MRRQNHHRQRRRITVDRVKQRHPVHPRHPQVGHHHLRPRHRQRRQRRLPGLHRRHRVPRATQPHPPQLQQVPVIVHQENLGILCAHEWALLSPRRGKVTRKCPPAPPPTTAIWPPCASTSSRAIARPRPLPFTPVSALVLPRKNRLKIDSRSSGGTPGPESMTSITASPAKALAFTEIVPPGGVNFTAFEIRLSTIERSFSGSASSSAVSGVFSSCDTWRRKRFFWVSNSSSLRRSQSSRRPR